MNLYLDLLKRCLTNWIYGEHEMIPVVPQGLLTPEQIGRFAAHGICLAKTGIFDPEQRRVSLHDRDGVRVLKEDDVLTHPVLPGFSLALRPLFALAERPRR